MEIAKITEIKNNKYKVEAFRMANDAKIFDVVPPIPNFYNFFLIICGVPMSGKTNLWLNLINKRKSPYYKKFDKVFIFSNSLHTIKIKIKLPESQLIQGIDTLEEVVNSVSDTDDKILIVLDDVISDIKDDEFMQKLIFNRRHTAGGVSLIIITQVYNKLPLQFRKCCTDLVLFNTSNKIELESIFREFINISKTDYQQIIRYCFKGSNHDFIWIDNLKNLFYKNFNLLKINLS